MGHTKFEDLRDIEAELKSIRQLPNLIEKKPGIFYYKATPFLHFHDKDGKRWADVKVASGWKTLDLDFDASKTKRAAFLKAVKQVHSKFKKDQG